VYEFTEHDKGTTRIIPTVCLNYLRFSKPKLLCLRRTNEFFQFSYYIYIYIYLYKVKCSTYRPGVDQRVGRGIVLLFYDRDTRRGWVVSSTPGPHFTPGKVSVPFLREAGWAPGRAWRGERSRPHRDSIPDRPARSQSPYRLSYRAPIYIYICVCVCIYIYICICMYIYIYMYIDIHISKYIK